MWDFCHSLGWDSKSQTSLIFVVFQKLPLPPEYSRLSLYNPFCDSQYGFVRGSTQASQLNPEQWGKNVRLWRRGKRGLRKKGVWLRAALWATKIKKRSHGIEWGSQAWVGDFFTRRKQNAGQPGKISESGNYGTGTASLVPWDQDGIELKWGTMSNVNKLVNGVRRAIVHI